MQRLAATPGGDPWWPIDARIYYDLETHNWADALQIQAPVGSPFDENLDIFWIHTVAAARLKQAGQASAFFEDFKKSSSEFESQHGWGDLIHLEVLEAEAWTLLAQQDRKKTIEVLRDAVKFEQAHPTYYPDVLARPSAEMLGDALLSLDSPGEAQEAYKTALAMAPNRLNSLIGARDAAASSQNAELAARYNAAITSICGNNADRKEAKNNFIR
jgi:tetratricopeptide (TPR) repeat protein